MLSIVRRKSEIPHQRHTLYAKYVDVIFDREKEKSPIVRERGSELLRLHERVGYGLHRKMEQTKMEALDRATFRSHVLSVLENYSGADLGQKKLREVADEIIVAATDRLCLLVGKGKEQTDIDFVVQSFREYFAGAYLFNHPDADPDRVFTTLIRRGAYWANVLQFYVAQANANQQMRWVASADVSTSHVDSVEELLDLVRTRRALLGVLPEFTIQRNQDFERTLRTLFAENTRWTWLGQEAVIEVLRIIRSGAARKTLWDMFDLLPNSDPSTLAVEIWLLAGLTEIASEEYAKLLNAVQNFLQQEDTRVIAWDAAVQNDILVNLSNIDIAHARFAHFRRQIRDLISGGQKRGDFGQN